jgi:hypothetical protein
MELVDDRTVEQKKSHSCIVVGTDSFLSGWGRAKNGRSYAGWACRREDLEKVFSWVKNRSDMKRVRIVRCNYRPSGSGHCHIYVVNEEHPAIN